MTTEVSAWPGQVKWNGDGLVPVVVQEMDRLI